MLNGDPRARNSLVLGNLGMTIRLSQYIALSKEYREAWLDLYGKPNKAKAQYYKMHVRPVKHLKAYRTALKRYNKAKHQIMLDELFGLNHQLPFCPGYCSADQAMRNSVSNLEVFCQAVGEMVLPAMQSMRDAMLRWGESLMDGFQTGVQGEPNDR